ncbi:MAG: hypothetical protein C0613_15045 [Desulfobulbaceae bacterium]|nr:MAG: hypothetical protein C0613_15045 [Desulfobulbaceae bacterium]
MNKRCKGQEIRGEREEGREGHVILREARQFRGIEDEELGVRCALSLLKCGVVGVKGDGGVGAYSPPFDKLSGMPLTKLRACYREKMRRHRRLPQPRHLPHLSLEHEAFPHLFPLPSNLLIPS